MEKFYLSKALLKMAGGGMHPPYPPLTVTLLFQTDDCRFSQGRMRCSIHTVEQRWRLGTFEDTTRVFVL